MSKSQQIQPTQPAPVPFEHQPELRTVMILTSIPAGCITLLVDHSRFEPHLSQGELAVIDPSDKEPERGEFYVIAYQSARHANGVVYEFCHLRRSWGFVRQDGCLVSTKRPDAEAAGLQRVPFWSASHGQGACSEGPLLTDGLRSMLVGRVVGIFVPKVGEEAR